MRASLVIAAVLAGLVAGVACARAADLAVEPHGEPGYGVCCRALYAPVPQVITLDDEPGVVVRHWWCPPWRNRHYYPHGGVSLKAQSSEREEPRRVARAKPHPGPSYFRYWTNYPTDVAPLIGPDVVPLPPSRPYAYRQPLPRPAAP